MEPDIEKKQMQKKVIFTNKVDHKHWVGDGFNVYGLLRPDENINKFISPFIMLDYANPKEFPKTTFPKGVGEHPHSGFETVTFAYQGEIEHRDSSGGGGIIKPGDVQWMTAGSGLVHDEFHSREFCKTGGVFEMVQLWVNLPKKVKMISPKYQSIINENIPKINIGTSSQLRIISGSFNNKKGPASTFTEINIFDIDAKQKDYYSLSFKKNTNTLILIMSGILEIEGKKYSENELLIFGGDGNHIQINNSENFKALVLNGTPINEPVASQGPFVMNTREEIIKAIEDFQSGKMGTLQAK
jgi:redox-sensitive bicupin YhaK (pirin superfamily)